MVDGGWPHDSNRAARLTNVSERGKGRAGGRRRGEQPPCLAAFELYLCSRPPCSSLNKSKQVEEGSNGSKHHRSRRDQTRLELKTQIRNSSSDSKPPMSTKLQNFGDSLKPKHDQTIDGQGVDDTDEQRCMVMANDCWLMSDDSE